MNNKSLVSAVVIGCGIIVAGFAVGLVSAQTTTGINDANISYPITELGNCQNQESCKTYCDVPPHIEACIGYAEKNNLMSKNEIDAAKKFLEAGAKGPGGCTGKDSCETYCNDISHIDECVAFAKKTGILPPDQLKEAEQVQAAIARGVKPPPCKNKNECDAYCEEPSNMKVCVAFGEAAGFLQGQELQDAKKIAAAIDAGATPPPCKGKDACDTYCSQAEHMETCMTFAKAAGLMSPQEMQDAQKTLDAIKKGAKPPACRGKEECDKYCGEKEHFDECTNFAVAAGFMNEKDAEMARKTGGKGPGGCKSKEECDAFCNNQDNQQTCMNFAKDNGLIPPEELQKMQEGQKQFQASFQNMPPEVLDCLKNSIGDDTLEKFKSGQAMPSRDVGEKMGQCFSKMGGPSGQEDRGQGEPGTGGPMSSGQLGPQGNFSGGPGGCKTPEECNTFCQSNPEVCKNFQPPTMQQGMKPQECPGEMQPNMPPQGQGGQDQNHGEMMPPNQGMPLRGGQPFDGTMPAGGNMPPFQQGMNQMMQPGNMQPPQDMQSGNMQPPFGGGLYPPQSNPPQSGNMPPPNGMQPPTGGGAPPSGGLQPPPGMPPNNPPPPQSYNPPTISQFLLGMVSAIFIR